MTFRLYGSVVAVLLSASLTFAEDYTYPEVADWDFEAYLDVDGRACFMLREYDDGSYAALWFYGDQEMADVSFLYSGDRQSSDMTLLIDDRPFATGQIDEEDDYVAVVGGLDADGRHGNVPDFLRAVAAGSVLSAAGWNFKLDGTARALSSSSFLSCMDDLFHIKELVAFGVRDVRPIDGTPKYLAESEQSEAYSIEVSDTEIVIEGPIDRGFSRAIADALAQSSADVIIRSSPGGYVEEAQMAGRLIRAHDRNVTVIGQCLSACLDVFAGGVERSVQASGRIGIHRGSLEDRLISYDVAQDRISESARYYREMGIDSDIVFAQLDTPAEDIRLLSHDELRGFDLLTN